MHRPQIVETITGRWRCLCNCKTGSPYFATRQDAEDWQFKHLRLAEQAMVHLRDRSPSIKDQYNYYLKKAKDPEESTGNRALWTLLAEGLACRLPDTPARNSTDEPLPFEVKYTPRNRSRDQP